jgi:polyisoprenoid-binding protein YceI
MPNLWVDRMSFRRIVVKGCFEYVCVGGTARRCGNGDNPFPSALWKPCCVSARLPAMNRRHSYRFLTLCIASLSAPFAAQAGTDSYRYDPVHSQIVFSIDHDGFSRPVGRLHVAKGWLRFDSNDWSRSSTELDIDMGSLDMGDAEWNKAVCKSSLLDCTTYPTAHFVSTSVERKDATHGVLHGVLSLHGVNQSIDIPFRVNRIGKTIYGMHTIAGFSATASIDRTAFGVTGFPNAIGHNVAIWLEVEGIRDSQISTDNKENP